MPFLKGNNSNAKQPKRIFFFIAKAFASFINSGLNVVTFNQFCSYGDCLFVKHNVKCIPNTFFFFFIVSLHFKVDNKFIKNGPKSFSHIESTHYISSTNKNVLKQF